MSSPSFQPLVPGAPELPDAPLVLVVDNDADIGETMAVDLRRSGMRVRTALTAEYAVAFCETQDFDAMVIDHPLSGEEGEHLLAEAPDRGTVIVSGSTPPVPAKVRHRHARKVFAVKTKPVAPSELVQVVRAAVSASRRKRKRR